MFGLGPSPLSGPMLVLAFAVWARLFWHELRQNRVSRTALLALFLLLMAWALLTSRRGFL